MLTFIENFIIFSFCSFFFFKVSFILNKPHMKHFLISYIARWVCVFSKKMIVFSLYHEIIYILVTALTYIFTYLHGLTLFFLLVYGNTGERLTTLRPSIFLQKMYDNERVRKEVREQKILKLIIYLLLNRPLTFTFFFGFNKLIFFCFWYWYLLYIYIGWK